MFQYFLTHLVETHRREKKRERRSLLSSIRGGHHCTAPSYHDPVKHQGSHFNMIPVLCEKCQGQRSTTGALQCFCTIHTGPVHTCHVCLSMIHKVHEDHQGQTVKNTEAGGQRYMQISVTALTVHTAWLPAVHKKHCPCLYDFIFNPLYNPDCQMGGNCWSLWLL